jgi:hypothetical protein
VHRRRSPPPPSCVAPASVFVCGCLSAWSPTRAI